MATFTADSFRINTRLPFAFRDFDDVDILSATPTLIVLPTPAGTIQSYSDSFTYSVSDDGALNVSGNITGFRETKAGALLYSVTRASLPVSEYLAYLNAGDSTGLEAEVFGGNDVITGSPLSDWLLGF